jgi:hypothetical protein
MKLGNTLSEKELTPQQQIQLLVELRSGFDEDGDDPSARGDIAQLLRMLRMRHDVTYRTRTEIDNVLAEIEAKDGKKADASATPATKAPAPASAAAGAATPAQPGGSPAPPASTRPTTAAETAKDGGSSKRLLIIGGAALAVVIAIVLVVVFASQGGTKKPAAQPSAGGQGGTTPAPTAPARVESILLGVQEVGTILGDPNMVSGARGDKLRGPQGTLSNPDCLGAFEPLEESVYGPSNPTAMRSEVVHTAGNDPAHRVVEAVASFASAEKARAFVESSAEKWRACAGQNVTLTGSNGKAVEWAVGNVTGAAPRITQVRTQNDGGGRTCQHTLSAVSDVVIDVSACGTDITDPATRMAEQMGTKATK